MPDGAREWNVAAPQETGVVARCVVAIDCEQSPETSVPLLRDVLPRVIDAGQAAVEWFHHPRLLDRRARL